MDSEKGTFQLKSHLFGHEKPTFQLEMPLFSKKPKIWMAPRIVEQEDKGKCRRSLLVRLTFLTILRMTTFGVFS
jgi:hypothetical protein